ncbi:MAG: PilZ domain-containing protein [Piscirickettsiaceae bacterium]|nr:PilZ domain-containing protein [Piscirickettsiaceae bacterium]
MTGSIKDRRYERIEHTAKVKVIISPGNERVLEMSDFSDGGLFVKCPTQGFIVLGDEVEVQTLEMEDAPVIKSKVVRFVKSKGFALEFIN